jgi:hypothetical protein
VVARERRDLVHAVENGVGAHRAHVLGDERQIAVDLARRRILVLRRIFAAVERAERKALDLTEIGFLVLRTVGPAPVADVGKYDEGRDQKTAEPDT